MNKRKSVDQQVLSTVERVTAMVKPENFVGNETDVIDSFTWTIFSKDGRSGVRCIYDKKSKYLSVEREGRGTHIHVSSLALAKIKARVFANEIFKFDEHQRTVRELLDIAQRLARR